MAMKEDSKQQKIARKKTPSEAYLPNLEVASITSAEGQDQTPIDKRNHQTIVTQS